MGPDTVKAIQDALAPLASKLGEGASHVYQVFTRQQYVQGVAELVGAAGLLIGAVVSAIIALSFYKKWTKIKADSESRYSEGETEGTITLVTSVLTIFLFVIFTATLANGLMHLLNPEYYGIKDILRTVKNCTTN